MGLKEIGKRVIATAIGGTLMYCGAIVAGAGAVILKCSISKDGSLSLNNKKLFGPEDEKKTEAV